MKPDPSNPHSDWIVRLFAHSHVAIGISRLADNRFVAVNDAFECLFGYKRRAIIDRTALELGLWPDPEERARLIAALRRGETVRAFEARFRTSKGATGNLQISASIVDFDGEQYLVGLLTDVTDHKAAERASHLNETRLNAVLKLSDLLVFHQDRNLRYTWVANPAFGSTSSGLLGRTDAQIMGARDARPLTAIKRRVLRSGKGERQEVWISHNGQTGCFNLLVEPERDADGRITGIVCAAADITQRKTAEKHLKLQADILGALQEGVNMVDAQGILRYTNPKFDAMFGYAPGELIGKPVAVLNAATEESAEETALRIIRALDREGRWLGEVKAQRKDGSAFWTQANIVTAQHPTEGKVWISAQSDVTELREARTSLQEAYRSIGRFADHLQDNTEAQRIELAREVHDEIGALLTGIRMQLDGLAATGRADDLEQIRGLVDRALATTRTICSRLRPPMLDDIGLIETMRWYVRDWARQSGIRASLRIAASTREPTDPLRTDLFRMLQELLTNVARHADARQVRISLGTTRGALTLRVTDDGRGFAPGWSNGFGLLGIRERLQRHGGTLDIADAHPGATISLRLPQVAA